LFLTMTPLSSSLVHFSLRPVLDLALPLDKNTRMSFLNRESQSLSEAVFAEKIAGHFRLSSLSPNLTLPYGTGLSDSFPPWAFDSPGEEDPFRSVCHSWHRAANSAPFFPWEFLVNADQQRAFSCVSSCHAFPSNVFSPLSVVRDRLSLIRDHRYPLCQAIEVFFVNPSMVRAGCYRLIPAFSVAFRSSPDIRSSSLSPGSVTF